MSEFGNMALFWTLLGTQSFGATLCILNSPSLGLAFLYWLMTDPFSQTHFSDGKVRREKLLRFIMCIQEPILWCLGDPSGDGLFGWSLWGVMVVQVVKMAGCHTAPAICKCLHLQTWFCVQSWSFFQHTILSGWQVSCAIYHTSYIAMYAACL